MGTHPINAITICMIGAGGFIGSHLYQKLMHETPHKIQNQTSLGTSHSPWLDRIQFHRLNVKQDSRLEGLIKMAYLVKHCSENNKRLINFSTCEVYGKTIEIALIVRFTLKVSGEPSLESPTIDVSSKEFYGEGYDDSDKRILNMNIINKQLGWNLLESTLTYQHKTYAETIKKVIAKPVAS
ncbi:hypothetical protein Lal_00009874 [Lupinus albus]|uniref:Putative UDP-glucuronate decarboxylase n=1 Tax=Lupinus albus TaxID=3870 RepID=A0A6A5LI10_LUPAL|nr:putative UDP-glucuronate decarboxylase [Lupinus albus]KAF1859290.1 hypothetical protein Lal_00009874 [Lupinus albus]